MIPSVSLRVSGAVAAALFFGEAVRAQSQPPSVAPPVDAIVTRAAVVELIEATLKAWERGDAAGFLSAFADDAVFAYPGGRVDKDGLAALFADLQVRKTDIKIHLGPFVVVGGEFALRYQFACTDRETGRRQAVGTGVRGSLRDGRIVVFKEYWDAAIALEQVAGRMPLDEGDPRFPAPASVVMGPERIN